MNSAYKVPISALALVVSCLPGCGNSNHSASRVLGAGGEVPVAGSAGIAGTTVEVTGSTAGGTTGSGGGDTATLVGGGTGADSTDSQGGASSLDVSPHSGGQTLLETQASGGLTAIGTSSAMGGGSSADIKPATGGATATGGAPNTGGNWSVDHSSASSATGGGSSADIKSASGGGSSADVKPATGGGSSADVKPPTGGATATGGSSATGGATATGGDTATGGATGNGVITAVDILYMIDNSSSMADKQQVLAASLPHVLYQLAQPNCVDGSGQIIGESQLTPTGATCATGKLEFKAINDIHIGVVSSSLGDHGGGSLCTPGVATSFTRADGSVLLEPPDVNDMGRLVGSLTRGAQALQGDSTIVQDGVVKLDPKGFLAWGSSDALVAPTAGELNSATSAFKDMVVATAQAGCGFESQLESWFRFLVDPVPPVYPIAAPDVQQQTHRTGVDDALLAQRAAFLRPNSLVVIIMLTDENDCSLRDTDVGWVAAKTSASIMTGSPACAANPNDPCCYSCTGAVPAGCAACPSNSTTAADDGPFQANVRCYEQKRRFGFSFLYPTSRYYVGLTHAELCPDQSFGDMDCDCTYAKSQGAACDPGARRLPNPLYSRTVGTDSKSNPVPAQGTSNARAVATDVYLTGIVGVPWQDLSESNSQAAGSTLKYIPVTDARWTNPGGIWSQIYGDDDFNLLAGDIHMVESLVPRVGLPGPNSTSPVQDPINGHEYNTAREDLEFACIFPLEGAAPARPCACTSTSADYSSCKYQNPNDCCDLTFNVDGAGGPGGSFDKPLCQNPTTGAYGNTQYFAKGYPGLREITVLHDYAVGPSRYSDGGGTGNSIVTSICPKVLTAGQEGSLGYGYNPAAAAIIERLKERLQP